MEFVLFMLFASAVNGKMDDGNAEHVCPVSLQIILVLILFYRTSQKTNAWIYLSNIFFNVIRWWKTDPIVFVN